MMHPRAPASWLLLVLAAAGCGGDDGAGASACDGDYHASCIDDELGAGSRGQCADFYGDAELLVAACDDATASRRTSPCDPAGSLGGCAVAGAGFCSVVWQFDPSGSTTAADVEAGCASTGSVYVPAP